MTTGILVALTIVLVLAAVFVGVQLLRRRPRPAPPAEAPGTQTVGDLVRQRTGAADDLSGDQLFTPAGAWRPAVAPAPSTDAARPGPADDAGTAEGAEDAEARTVEVPVPQPMGATPPSGEVGDAPWRRAARMRGEEPGAGWDTAPLPILVNDAQSPSPVPPASRPPAGASRAGSRPHVEPAPAAAAPGSGSSAAAQAPEPARTGSVAVAPGRGAPGQGEPGRAEPGPGRGSADRAVEPGRVEPGRDDSSAAERPAAAPATGAAASAAPAVGAHVAAEQAVAGPPPAVDAPAAVEQPDAGPAVHAPAAAGPAAVEPDVDVTAPRPAAPRPGTDRTAREQATAPVRLEPGRAAARPTPTPRAGDPASPRSGGAVWVLPEAVAAAAAANAEPRDDADGDTAGPSRPLSDPDLTPLMGIPIVRPLAAEVPVPPPPRVAPADEVTAPRPLLGVPLPARASADDDVVSMSSPVGSAPPPAVRTGSPQPVWFRVVRRDGEPVAAAVVSLLDDHGQEVDTTKTATDGGGELRSPHGGRFLMIVSAEGFQPRAALLTVEERPVELALLLPRSASVAGAVRSEGRSVTGARVVVRQEGEIVDDLVTGRDGAYRFNDLAEGGYVLSATDHRGNVVRQVRLSEGDDLPVDLDLVYREGAR